MKGDRDGVYNTAEQGVMLRPTIVGFLLEPSRSVALRGVTSSRTVCLRVADCKTKRNEIFGLVKICRAHCITQVTAFDTCTFKFKHDCASCSRIENVPDVCYVVAESFVDGSWKDTAWPMVRISCNCMVVQQLAKTLIWP